MNITSGKAGSDPAKYEQIITVSKNTEKHGIELSFRFKPSATQRAILKRAGYKWNYTKMVWYAKDTPDHAAAIGDLTGTINYPDGWTADHRATERKAPDFAEWIKNHAAAILKAAATDRPDFMELSEADQNDIYMSAAKTMYQYAA